MINYCRAEWVVGDVAELGGVCYWTQMENWTGCWLCGAVWEAQLNWGENPECGELIHKCRAEQLSGAALGPEQES